MVDDDARGLCEVSSRAWIFCCRLERLQEANCRALNVWRAFFSLSSDELFHLPPPDFTIPDRNRTQHTDLQYTTTEYWTHKREAAAYER